MNTKRIKLTIVAILEVDADEFSAEDFINPELLTNAEGTCVEIVRNEVEDCDDSDFDSTGFYKR